MNPTEITVKQPQQTREEYVKAKVNLAVECCALAHTEGIAMMYTDYEEGTSYDTKTTKVGPPKRLNIVAFSTNDPAIIAAITSGAQVAGDVEEE